MKQLFNTLDTLLGEVSVFKGLAFELEHGTLVVDYFNDTGEDMYIASFFENGEDEVKFAAKGTLELGEQIAHYVLS